MIFVKTLSHWFFKVSNDIYGGVPPTLDGIKTEHEKVKLFLYSLSFNKTGIMHNTKLQRIIISYILIFHEAFLGIIGN